MRNAEWSRVNEENVWGRRARRLGTRYQVEEFASQSSAELGASSENVRIITGFAPIELSTGGILLQTML